MTRYEHDDYSEWGKYSYIVGPTYQTAGPHTQCETDEYDPSEQDDVIKEFVQMLRRPTGDGGRKRAAGEKPSWKVDTDHERGLFSHLAKWKAGEFVDRDSGAHPLVHAAWRCLALAYQERDKQSQYIADRLSDPAMD